MGINLTTAVRLRVALKNLYGKQIRPTEGGLNKLEKVANIAHNWKQ